MVDLTPDLQDILDFSAIVNGNMLVFVPGSTGGISTIEFEPGLIRDLPALMESIVPEKSRYFHNETWHDGNGHSHLRATLIGPSITIPFENSSLILGTWQQVVFVEFDNRPRKRQIVVQMIGE